MSFIKLEDLGMWKINVKLVPKLLTEDQKTCLVDVNIITEEETLVFQYDSETKQKSLQ